MNWARLDVAVANAEKWLASLLMVAITALVFIAAVTRYLGHPVNWSIDLAQGMFVWAIFLGASRAMRKNGHIGISLLVDLLPPNARRVVEIVTNVIVALFLTLVTYYGMQISIVNYERELTSFPVSYSYVTIAISVGSALMLITTLRKLAALLGRMEV